jgi:ring-1,2-phenylacetyl-CoA epoxidase subunit PaaC
VKELLLELADDELILGWRDSEWTGIAPLLEEDVALSSIAQNEIGHARAAYELLADDADALALDRDPSGYRCAPIVQLRLLEWAPTIARRILYELADEIRLGILREADDPRVRGLAEKMDREEAYHRMHAELWRERLRGDPRFEQAVEELWPYAVALLPEAHRPALADRAGLPVPGSSLLRGKERGSHTDDFRALREEMTIVRRSAPAGARW